MLIDLLDPKNDVVFKAILVPECNEDVLISLITAVTKPPKKIVSAKVQNPELPKKKVTDKGVARANMKLHNFHHIDSNRCPPESSV